MSGICSSKASTFTALSIVAFVVSVHNVAAEPRDFLRKVSIREVEADLQATLAELISGTSQTATRRISNIEASMWQTFQALPKNTAGRLAPPAVRYIVHGYFAREHGWLIKGLEPHGMQLSTSDVHDVDILQDKAPLLVENLLEAGQAGLGLAFNDVVAMITVLERMMFDESLTLLQAAYSLNGLAVVEDIDDVNLHRVLQSYLVLFGQGSKANLLDADHHQALLQSRQRPEIEEFERNAVLNFEYVRRHQVNPFKPRQYSFNAVAEIIQDLAQRYGKWQNSECRDMKAHLKELDPEGVGTVPLGLFYAQPAGSSYHFGESTDYLRKIGALDETSPSSPQVFIANYVAGPSNCIASSSYYSVCCLSECDEILNELEHHVSSPTASPETLLSLVSNISDTALKQGLPEKLRAIAARHDGQVPLHGRLFAQWLHFAFPHECPYPSILASATALSVSQWLDGRSASSEEERRHHVASASMSLAEDLDINGRWSDHEVLPVHSEPRPLSLTVGLRVIMQFLAICVAIRSVVAAWRASRRMHDGAAKKNDDHVAFSHDDFALPLHV